MDISIDEDNSRKRGREYDNDMCSSSESDTYEYEDSIPGHVLSEHAESQHGHVLSDFSIDDLDVDVPRFDIRQTMTNKRHLVFDPKGCSPKKTAHISKFTSPTSSIFAFRLPYDEPKGILDFFQQFQAAYYVLWTAAFLSASQKNLDITTHLHVIKKDAMDEGDVTHKSFFEMIRDGISNKGSGFYLAEVHVHDAEALSELSDALTNCASLFSPREIKNVGPSAFMLLKESIEKHYPKPDTENLVFFQSREDFARGLVMLGEYQKTIEPTAGRGLKKLYKDASVSTILQITSPDDSENRAACFHTLFSRESTFNSLLSSDIARKFKIAETERGEVFIDEYKAYQLALNNVKNMVAYQDCPGSPTHWLTKLLILSDKDRFYQETYIDNDAGLKFLDELVVEHKNRYDFPGRVHLVARYMAGDHPMMEPYAKNIRETMKFMYNAVRADVMPDNMSYYVSALTADDVSGCRVGSIYLNQLFLIVDKFEFTCKLHSIRIAAQYIRDVVFFMDTEKNPPNLMLFGDPGGGKSRIFDQVKECSVNGMFEDCAWESQQGGMRTSGKKIKLNHEGKPNKTNKNVANNEASVSLEKVGFSQGRKEPLEVHRMASDGSHIVVRYKNLSRDWSAVNFSKNLVYKAIIDRAICKSTNAQTPHGRNSNLFVQAENTRAAIQRKTIAHDELRHRLFYFLGYDALDTVVYTEKDSDLFIWVINQLGTDVPDFDMEGLLSGNRENTYTWLIARAHTLHSLVSILFYDLAVPSFELLTNLSVLVENGTPEQKFVFESLKGMCNLTRSGSRNDLDFTDATPKPFVERFLGAGDSLLAECFMFQTVDAILTGIVTQTDPHMQNDIKLVKGAIKTLCQDHGRLADDKDLTTKYKICTENDVSDYHKRLCIIEFGKDALVVNIERILCAENISRSEDTITSVVQFLYNHVVHNNGTSSLAVRQSSLNGSALFFEKKLFNDILTKCEKVVIGCVTKDIAQKMDQERERLAALRQSNESQWAEVIKHRLGIRSHRRSSCHQKNDLKALYSLSEPQFVFLEWYLNGIEYFISHVTQLLMDTKSILGGASKEQRAADYRSALGETLLDVESDYLASLVTDKVVPFYKSRRGIVQKGDIDVFVRRFLHSIVEIDGGSRVNSLNFIQDIGFGFFFLSPRARDIIGSSDKNGSAAFQLFKRHVTSDEPDSIKASKRLSLLKELLDGNPQKKLPPKREDVSAILYDIVGPENLVCDFFDVLTPEELDVLVRASDMFSDNGDLCLSHKNIGKGSDVKSRYAAKPERGLQYGTVMDCVEAKFHTGKVTDFNDPTNIYKFDSADMLFISRQVLNHFKLSGETVKNPIHKGIEEMMKRLNISSPNKKEHFYITEPVSRDELKPGRIDVPHENVIRQSVNGHDIKMNNVAFLSKGRISRLSKRMRTTYSLEKGLSRREFVKKSGTNPEEDANRAWYDRCRISKMIMKGTTGENRRNGLKMNNLIYNSLASYRAVNRKLANTNVQFAN